MNERIKERLEKLIDASYVAIDELIEVAKRKIVFDEADESVDELKVDKLKTAAQAKKIAVFDSVDIAKKIMEIEELIDPSESNEEIESSGEIKELKFGTPESRANN